MSSPSMFPEPKFFEQILHQRLRWMVRLRWLVAGGILLTILLAERIVEVGYSKPPLFVIVGLILVYNLVMELLLFRLGQAPGRRSLFIHANLQMALDFGTLLLLVAFTGGVQNLFVFYVVFHIVISSILLPRKNAIAATVMICLACTALFWADYLGLIPEKYWLVGFLPASVRNNPTYVFGLNYIFATVVMVTAYMAITISKNLRDAERRMLTLAKELYRQQNTCQQQNRELLELEDKKNEFLQLAAHQLRAPLDRLNHSAEQLLLDQRADITEDCNRSLTQVHEDVKVMHDLVDDLLESARLADLERGLPSDQVDLDAAARQVMTQMKGLAQKYRVEIKAEIAENIPNITGDAPGWPKVFSNLIENAVRYSPPGAVVEFRLDRDWQGERITGEVKDRGMGISPDDISRIFDEFYRAEPAKQKAPGTGMGLSITRKIIELHGGRIEVKSEQGVGSSFKFYVPIKKPGPAGA